MKSELTKAEYALLGLLLEKPSHGYDLEKTIANRNMRDWTELAFSSIYYILKRLEDRNLVTTDSGPTAQKRARKIFSPTAEGRAIHSRMTLEFLGQPEVLYPGLLLGLANWPSVGQEQALAALEHRKGALQAVLGDLTNKTETQPVFVSVMFDYSITHLKAELDWVDKALETLGEN